MDAGLHGEEFASYRFGLFDLDGARLELRRDGVVVDIEPKPLEVLLELVRNAGQLVTKDDLMESVWGGRPVTDYVLTRCISRLRAALGDSGLSMITSVYGQGYRFSAPVASYPSAPPRATMHLVIAAGDPVPARPHWHFERPLDAATGVWLAVRAKSGERRVFKFALTPDRIPSLKREITVHRLLGSTGADDVAIRMLDFNLGEPPYFLELDWNPDGSLLDWCTRQGGIGVVPEATRLELLAVAAEGLARAHAAGVLHLDVKPANLLVSFDAAGRARVRWSDFGSSRVLSPERLESLGITRLGARTEAAADVGTLHYIAPEVIAGREPSTQSDVYALGVMLYQLVSGDFSRPLTAGWEHDVTDPLLREDVAAAAAGDPARRLGSALELARRLRALPERRAARLADEQRRAHAEELERRLARVRARRPWLIGVAAALVLATATSLWGVRQATRARDQARADAAVATGLREFFSADVLGAASNFDPTIRRDLTVREALDRALTGIEAKHLAPLVEAQVHGMMAFSYLQLSDYDKALRENRRAVELFARARGADDPLPIQTSSLEPEILLYACRFEEALRSLEHLDRVRAGRTDLDADMPLAIAALRGAVYFQTGRYSEALPYYRDALALYLRMHPDAPAGLATRHEMLALTYAHLGRFAAARDQLQRDRAAAAREREPIRSTATAMATLRTGVALHLEGLDEDAERLLRAAHDALAERIGSDDLDVAEGESLLGLLLSMRGHATEGLVLARHAHEALQARYGDANVEAADALVRLGQVEAAAHDREHALPDLRRAYDALRNLLGENAPDTALAGFEYASIASRDDAAASRTLAAGLSPAPLLLAAPALPWAERLRDLRRMAAGP